MTDNQINVSTPNKNVNIGTTAPVENLNTNVSAPSTTANAYVTQDLSRYYSDLAKDYSDLAMNWAIKIDGPVQGAEHSSKYYATLAKESETLAIESANTAEQNAINTLENANEAIEAKEQAAISATSAVESAQNASVSANTATQKASEANISEINARISADSASTFSNQASNAATLCVQSTQQAQTSAADAELSAQQAAHAGAGLVPGLLFFSPDPQTDANLYPADGSLIAADGKHSDFVTEYIDPLYNKLSKTINAEVVGDLTIEDGVVSGFSDENYLILPISNFVQSIAWTIEIPFVTPEIFIDNSVLLDAGPAEHPFRISIMADGTVSLWLTDGSDSSTIRMNSSTTLSPNTAYTLRFRRLNTARGGTFIKIVNGDGTYTYIGLNEISQSSVSSTTINTMYIGRGRTELANPATGYKIDMAGVTISYLDTDVWIPNLINTRFTTEEDFQAQVAANGICDKYVYNQGESVRVPKLGNKLYTHMPDDIPTLGNGMTLGVTDGTNFAGVVNGSSTTYTFMTKSTFYGVPAGTAEESGNDVLKDISIGLTTDGTKSGVIADTSAIPAIEGYWYIVVGTVTKTDIQVDIDNITTDINGKADKDLSNCTNSFFVDGAIVESYIEAFNSTSTGIVEIDLSEYLPNDGHNYEVLISSVVVDSGTQLTYIYSDIITTKVKLADLTGNSTRNTNIFWFPVGIQRKLVLSMSATTTENILSLHGYRRLGRNG